MWARSAEKHLKSRQAQCSPAGDCGIRVRIRSTSNCRSGQRLRILPTRQDRAQLATLTALIEDAKLTPVLDRIYPLAETDAGLRHVETGHARGKVVITVA
jgi:NADPH:quinone reductase-like Zn-dependent oxidoreductase